MLLAMSVDEMTFNDFFDRLIKNEGGYVNNPKDPGGETNWGITWPKLREAIGMGLVPSDTTIARLNRDQARIIYRALFWEKGRMDQFDPAVSFQVFDFAVNSGIDTAIRHLQRAAGVAEDGNVGPVTIAAINHRKPQIIVLLFIAERLDFWRHLSTWPTFGNGWTARAAMDLRYAAQDLEEK